MIPGTRVVSVVDRHWLGRHQLDQWLVEHGVKGDHVHSVQRLVVQPGNAEALAVFPWTREAGQLYVRITLDEVDRFDINRDAPAGNDEAGRLHPAIDTVWRDALTVECPYGPCRAHVGDWCVTDHGIPRQRGQMPHQGRVMLSRQFRA